MGLGGATEGPCRRVLKLTENLGKRLRRVLALASPLEIFFFGIIQPASESPGIAVRIAENEIEIVFGAFGRNTLTQSTESLRDKLLSDVCKT